jgi:hypothetical protein
MSQSNVETPVVGNIYVNKVKEGEVFKNYKEVCTHLGVDITTGNARIAQHKEWQRYFEYEKEGQKYIITEVYTEPLPKDDGRTKGNNSEYLPYIELILLDYLSQQHDKVASLTVKKLFLLLGMCNEHYLDENFQIPDEEEINDYYIKHFNQRSYKKLNRILFNALNNLKNRRLIDYQSAKMICIEEKRRNKTYKKIRQATPEECDIIRNIERATLMDMGFESIILVHLKYKTEEFYSRVQSELNSLYGITFYYTQINLRFTHEHVVQAKEKTQSMILLNDKIIDGLNKEAETKLLNNQKKIDEAEESSDCWGLPKPYSGFRYDEEAYMHSQQKLAEYLIKI